MNFQLWVLDLRFFDLLFYRVFVVFGRFGISYFGYSILIINVGLDLQVGLNLGYFNVSLINVHSLLQGVEGGRWGRWACSGGSCYRFRRHRDAFVFTLAFFGR